MSQIKEFAIDGVPTESEIAEALLIAKSKKCQVNLRWFNHIPNSGVSMGENKLAIKEDMTFKECLDNLGVPAIKELRVKK